MGYTRADWSEHYTDGRGFRPLGDQEKALLVEHVPAAEGGRALDACCGTGELATFLAALGYTVDGADFAEGALARARSEHAGADGVRWLCLDIEHDDLSVLAEDGYDLITMRLSVALIRDRTRAVRSLSARLRPGGILVIITPVVASTSQERQDFALDEDEINLVAEGWEQAEQYDADGLAFLVLRAPQQGFTAVEKGRPTPQAVLGACVVITHTAGRVLLGRSTRGMWELPGGRIETGESAQAAAVRELAEETGLKASLDDTHLLTILHDDRADVRRISAVVRVTAWTADLALPEPHRFTRWEWHDLHTLASLGPVFAPSAQALEAVWPGVLPGLPPVHSYPRAMPPSGVDGESAEAVRLRNQMVGSAPATGCSEAEAALALDSADARSEVRTGRCECGHIAYEVVGFPDDPHLCSCRHEKRLSGGPAVLWVGFPKTTLTWTGPGGEPTWYATWPTLRRGFCPRCGSHLVSIADDSDMIMVTGFSLDDRSGIAPVGHSFREESVPWMTIALAPDPRAG
ncbi:NUDIX domain-containing protein [Streptomyces sp. NPDC021212]|uniref:NUDIX domain-containing protein n=1 Tax=Streptomyces sp. NPDC021212 TaxID=3365118 RepID=UPI0037AFE65F